MTSPVHGTSAAGVRESGAADVTGVLVLGACAAWALITAAGRDARPEGVLLAVLAVGGGYATGRIAGSLAPAGAAAGAAGVCLALFGPATSRMISGGVEFAGPHGRSGVTAALLTLAAGAFCCSAWAARAHAARAGMRLATAGTVAAALLVGTPVGAAAALAVLACSLAAARIRRRARALAAMALAVAAVAGVTFAVAHDGLPRGTATALHEPLTDHRVELWRDALGLTREHPVLGAGPGTFGELSGTARESGARPLIAGQESLSVPPGPASDDRPHSAPLQIAAEQGLPGLALLAAAFGWLLLALRASPRATPVVLTAGAALSALGALAAIGNALSFTQVTAGAGLLAGIGCARGLS